jgi:hypothetical protein
MKRKTQFESSDDVEQYFAFMSELTDSPVPPEDLWEQLDKARRTAQRRYPDQRRRPVPRPPESLQVEVTIPARRQKVYPIKVVERIETVPGIRMQPSKIRRLGPSAVSLRELL